MALTVDDLASYINMPGGAPASGTTGRAELQRALDSAVQEVTRKTGRLDATSATARVPMLWQVVLPLPYLRLTSIGPVTDPNGIAVTPWWTDLESGIVRLYAGTPGTWQVVCTSADPWPAALATAALDWAAHLYDTQRARLNPTDDDQGAPPSFALPNRVAELLHDHLVPGIA